jgi:lipopolysaccharide heptosyltransferase II
MTPRAHPEHPWKIVIRSVNWLGDAVMSMPALQRLRKARPGDRICILTHEKLAELWRLHPAIDQVVPFSKDQGIWSTARALRAGEFDIALLFPNSFRSALEPFLARIKSRIGYAGNRRSFLLTHSVPRRAAEVPTRKRSTAEIHELVRSGIPGPQRIALSAKSHHIYHYLELTKELGAVTEPEPPTLAISEADRDAFISKFSLQDARGAALPIVGLNPGAEYGPAKRWPVEYFAQAALQIFGEIPALFLLFGSTADQTLTRQIADALSAASAVKRPSFVDLAGRTSLRELATGLSLCSVLLTNDTGPMHLATAVGTRVIVPFGSTAPELTAPGLPGDRRNVILRSNAPCSPCFRRECPIDLRCLTAIQPELASSQMRNSLTS